MDKHPLFCWTESSKATRLWKYNSQMMMTRDPQSILLGIYNFWHQQPVSKILVEYYYSSLLKPHGIMADNCQPQHKQLGMWDKTQGCILSIAICCSLAFCLLEK